MNRRIGWAARLAMIGLMIGCGWAIFSGGGAADEPATNGATDSSPSSASASSPRSSSPTNSPQSASPSTPSETPAESAANESTETPPAATRQDLVASLTIFALAIFVGFEIITKVPPTLHTPLMSGSNAISGITIVGAVIVTGTELMSSSVLGLIAVILATINVVGGFLVTHRMLAMFKRR